MKSLDSEETASRTFLSKADATPEEIARTLAAFEGASREYQRYRHEQCEYVASLAFGGNGAEDRRLLCQIELDRRRTSNLKEARTSASNYRDERPGEP